MRRGYCKKSQRGIKGGKRLFFPAQCYGEAASCFASCNRQMAAMIFPATAMMAQTHGNIGPDADTGPRPVLYRCRFAFFSGSMMGDSTTMAPPTRGTVLYFLFLAIFCVRLVALVSKESTTRRNIYLATCVLPVWTPFSIYELTAVVVTYSI